MEHYLIDFENVSSAGLEGMAGLGRDSFVYIIYTTSSTKIRLDALENVDCGGFRTIRVRAGKQSLDMHLISYLGYLIGSSSDPKKDKFRIISGDRDYDGTAEFWRERMGYDVAVQKTIGGKVGVESEEDSSADTSTMEPKESSSRKRRRKRHGRKNLEISIQEEMTEDKAVEMDATAPVEAEESPVSEPEAEESPVQEETKTEEKPAGRSRRKKRTLKAEETEVPLPSPAEEPEAEAPGMMDESPVTEEERAAFEKTVAAKKGKKNLKNAIYRSLCNQLGQERGSFVYKSLKGEIKKLEA